MPSMFSASTNMKSVKTKREIFHAVGADIVAHHVGHELVGDLGDRLEPRRHQRAAAHGVEGEERDQRGRDHHEQGGVGEGGVEAEQLERDEPLDLELVHGVRQAAPALRRMLHAAPSGRLSQRPTLLVVVIVCGQGPCPAGVPLPALPPLRGPYHVQDPGGGAKDQEHHHQERRGAKEARSSAQPMNAPDAYAGDQLSREPAAPGRRPRRALLHRAEAVGACRD